VPSKVASLRKVLVGVKNQVVANEDVALDVD
jgi:hypothetical protein